MTVVEEEEEEGSSIFSSSSIAAVLFLSQSFKIGRIGTLSRWEEGQTDPGSEEIVTLKISCYY